MNLITNVNVYGIENSIKASKYPKAVDVTKCNADLTKGIEALAKSPIGHGHDNWLNGIVVQFDLTCTIKMWTELERYHFIDFVSSQSTMHKIADFRLDDDRFSPYIDPLVKGALRILIDEYNKAPTADNYLRVLYNVPVGFRLTARMTTNYRQLKTMYQQRKTHRLPEWREFCEWVETLPHADLIIGDN